jgi:hypothetical protein
MKFSKLEIISNRLILQSCSNDEEGPAIPGQVPDFEEAEISVPTEIGNPFYDPGASQNYVYKGGEAGMPP